MSIQINQIVAIALLWLMCLLQDKWFDKLLKYQISGQAEKLKKSPKIALKIYENKNNGYLWILTAIGISIAVFLFVNGVLIFKIVGVLFGSIICFVYIFRKLVPYNQASRHLQ